MRYTTEWWQQYVLARDKVWQRIKGDVAKEKGR